MNKAPHHLTSLPNELNEKFWLLNGEPVSACDLIWQAMQMDNKANLPFAELMEAACEVLEKNGHHTKLNPEYQLPF